MTDTVILVYLQYFQSDCFILSDTRTRKQADSKQGPESLKKSEEK